MTQLLNIIMSTYSQCRHFRGDASTGSKRRGMKYLDNADLRVLVAQFKIIIRK